MFPYPRGYFSVCTKKTFALVQQYILEWEILIGFSFSIRQLSASSVQNLSCIYYETHYLLS